MKFFLNFIILALAGILKLANSQDQSSGQAKTYKQLEIEDYVSNKF